MLALGAFARLAGIASMLSLAWLQGVYLFFDDPHALLEGFRK
jgi:hypothetical protein